MEPVKANVPGALGLGDVSTIVDGTYTVTLPAEAANYYWRVDSYLDGDPEGTPKTGGLYDFAVVDSDGDGIPDAWKDENFTDWQNNPDSAATADPDGDGKTNLTEYLAGTDPNTPDTDRDGLLDGGNLVVTNADARYSDFAAAGIHFTDDGIGRTFNGEAHFGSDPLDTADNPRRALPAPSP